VGVPTDDDGIIPEELTKILDKYGDRVKLMYVIPDYQNPTGRAWSLERRKQFVKITGERGIPVVEDAPYRELTFTGEMQPPLKALDTAGNIIFLGSFSKVFAPGYRISYVCAEKEIINMMVYTMQGAFLQSATASEVAISKYLELYDLDAHIEEIRKVYKRRGELMIRLMEDYFPKEVSFTKPKGGMFAWVTLPEGCNSHDLLKICLDKKLAFVVGDGFYPGGDVLNTFRVSFANMSDERIETGVLRLADAIKEYLKG
jgi:2-aminoadipate transaminase